MERIGAPTLDYEVRGNKTVLKNFGRLCKVFRRDTNYLSKFLSQELATRGKIEGGMLEFQGVFSRDDIMLAIESYLKEYVYCKKCLEASGKLCLDTHLVKEGKSLLLECEACGSKYKVAE